LPIKSYDIHLKESFEYYCREEDVRDFFCRGCQKSVSSKRRTYLWKLPDILILHIRKAAPGDQIRDSKIDIPLKLLHLSNFLFEDAKDKCNLLLLLR